ncbi:hypothetical protein YDYSG_27430 [Paenibacillus tyrfis]|nr:hypothetical protein YDYSG_27430 [Paenibacillus tyrfis]
MIVTPQPNVLVETEGLIHDQWQSSGVKVSVGPILRDLQTIQVKDPFFILKNVGQAPNRIIRWDC